MKKNKVKILSRTMIQKMRQYRSLFEELFARNYVECVFSIAASMGYGVGGFTIFWA